MGRPLGSKNSRKPRKPIAQDFKYEGRKYTTYQSTMGYEARKTGNRDNVSFTAIFRADKLVCAPIANQTYFLEYHDSLIARIYDESGNPTNQGYKLN